MSPLDDLREMIASDGPITIERYMQLCLQHPRWGYYTTREAIGRAGDFITAPEIDQMFGELIGLWAAQVWLDMGAPSSTRLVELGPGRGTLMADALRATRIVPGFHEAIRVDLVETSPRLKAQQRQALRDAAASIAWYRDIDDVPTGPAIILANEFFDALPVRHYVRDARGWHERVVGLNCDGALAFGAMPEPIEIVAASGKPGDILEVGHAAIAVMASVGQRLATQGGALLVCDYGHVEPDFGETLQALRGHAYADVLATPGEADLTAHVDFSTLTAAARQAGAVVYGPVPQGTFLARLGIVERATTLKARADARQAEAIDKALHRLSSDESSMATLFKVMAVASPEISPPPGFATA